MSHYGLLGVCRANNVTVIGGCLDANEQQQQTNLLSADGFFNCIGSGGAAHGVTFRNIHMKNAIYSGLHVCGYHFNLLIDGCEADHCARGVLFDTDNIHGVCSNCYLHDHGTAGIVITCSKDVEILNCTATDNASYGVLLGSSEDITVSDCEFSNNIYDLHMDDSGGVMIDDCTPWVLR